MIEGDRERLLSTYRILTGRERLLSPGPLPGDSGGI